MKNNGVWKWVAGLLAAVLLSVAGTYAAVAGDNKERLVKVETAIEYLIKILDRLETYHHNDDGH